MNGKVALVLNAVGQPRIVGEYKNANGAIVWRIWDADATYDTETKEWSAVAIKDTRRATTSADDKNTFARGWMFLRHLECADQNMSAPYFGAI